jgi:hypothetical protein
MQPEEQDRWLTEHIPHRVRACLTGIPLQEELMRALDEDMCARIKMRCLSTAVFEGRLAGMRWLIEFVGISELNGKPRRPNRHDVDVSIAKIARGNKIDLASPEAVLLSKVWKGWSQASGHPTQDSNHPSGDEKALDAAMRIIIGHLEKTIYSSSRRRLTDEALRV